MTQWKDYCTNHSDVLVDICLISFMNLNWIFCLLKHYKGIFISLKHDSPGSIQARGENLFSLVKAFTSSSKLQNAMQRELLRVSQNETIEERAVFFDYLSLFMVFSLFSMWAVSVCMVIAGVYLTCSWLRGQVMYSYSYYNSSLPFVFKCLGCYVAIFVLKCVFCLR